MKYLKFYEAFQSKGISNTVKFLKEKVGDKSAKEFVDSLISFMANVDYPIDIISDDNIKYLNSKKALQLKCESPLNNDRNIWVLKFWFSLEKGYLGFTATGNKIEEVETGRTSGIRDTTSFTDRDFEYIKDRLTQTGEIWKVTDYNKLKTGDTVIGQFDSSDRDRIAFAKIFVDERDGGRTYAIQNVSSGSTPDYNEDWRNYTQYGDLSWWIFDDNEGYGNDHCKLHYWRPSSDEIHYIEPPKEEKIEKEKEENPFTWNLPLNSRLQISNWRRSFNSIESMKSVEESDFALVLYYDLLKSEKTYTKPSETKLSRSKSKEGATKLMSDVVIKTMNIERYIKNITSSLNITETEFSDLSKIVTKHLAQEYSYISVYFSRPDWSDLETFTDYFYKLVDSEPEDKQYYLNRIKDIYEQKVRNYYNFLLRYQQSKTLITKNDDIKKLFDEVFKLGNLIHKKFSSMQVNSIEDLFMIKSKFRSLNEFMRLSRNQPTYMAKEIISSFRSQDEFKYYCNEYSNSYNTLTEDLEKLKRVEKFLNSI